MRPTKTITAVLVAAVVGLMTFAFADTSTEGGPCKRADFEDTPYTVCRIDPAVDDVRLFRLGRRGEILGGFAAINQMLADDGETLSVAMNGGMYHDDRSPVGLYIEDGVEQMRLIPNPGPGNFGLLPNGVLCLNDGSAQVIETLRFRDNPPECRYATQSGPMLVIDGALHPRFLPDSDSKFTRNGVGVDADGILWFVISDRAVNFLSFGRFFRDHLKTPNALFMDGKISRFYARDAGRHDGGFPMGPILGTVVPLVN